jgi:signal transduction histidine kinase
VEAVRAAVDLDGRIRAVISGVTVVSRFATLIMVALSVVSATQLHAYTSVPLAATAYAVVGGWTAVFVTVLLTRSTTPGWLLTTDVAVTCAGMIGVAEGGRTPRFEDLIANPDLEPVTVAVAVGVALISASAVRVTMSCLAMAVAFLVAQYPVMDAAADVTSNISVIGWQVGTGVCCLVFIRRLRAVVDAVDEATEQVLAARERVAARRAHTEERMKHFREQLRRYRALHDGPLRILTAIAGPGPAGHPDAAVRRQCAVSVNVLRGATPDELGGSLTDLSLALIEAGNQCAAYGLRVTYHFANLPDDLPSDVVAALSRASAEALSNVATHAGAPQAQLTALSPPDAPHRPAVAVAVVDQGKGFDPDTAARGYGITHSIIERMAEVGGTASIDSHPGQGTRVDLRWPA